LKVAGRGRGPGGGGPLPYDGPPEIDNGEKLSGAASTRTALEEMRRQVASARNALNEVEEVMLDGILKSE